jgi:DNA invertase Pin-like site-specific DNA recombinase
MTPVAAEIALYVVNEVSDFRAIISSLATHLTDTEIESGKRDDRPQLAKAIDACRLYGARLVIAKLDHLSRDIHFLTGLERAGIRFVAADMPEANEMVVHMMAVITQAERKMISARTKVALKAAKARGTVMGGFRGFVPTDEHRRAAVEARQERAETRTGQLAPLLAQKPPGRGHHERQRPR